MNTKEKTRNAFLFNIIEDEECINLSLITKQDVSKIAKRLEKTKIKNLVIEPIISPTNTSDDNLFVVFEDIMLSEDEIGMIKNLLSQKIVIFGSLEANNDMKMTKLGFQQEFKDANNNRECFSYNLKTYNNKRSWNNPEGWANPENFDKFRW